MTTFSYYYQYMKKHVFACSLSPYVSVTETSLEYIGNIIETLPASPLLVHFSN